MKRHVFSLICLLIAIGSSNAQTERLQVLTSNSIIADIAQNVGGDLVEVTSLIPPNSDSHAFELRASDLVRLSTVDVLLINGAGYESFLSSVLADTSISAYVVGLGVPILGFGSDSVIGNLGQDLDCDSHEHHEDEATEEALDVACDPHYWLNPQNALLMVDNIAALFVELDPANATVYQANAEAYQAEIQAIDSELAALFAALTPEARVIVTNHEFLAYFANRYDLTILGNVLPSVSSLAEVSPRELAALSEQIRQTQVKAIFTEVSSSNRLAESLAHDLGLRVIPLYSESLSAPDGGASTYLDYLRYNAQAIASGLAE